MKNKVLQYIEEVKIDDRLKKPFGGFFCDRLGDYYSITYFTLKELQELYFFRELHSNYNAYFFNLINDFFEKNIQYKTSNKDILFCINSFDKRGLYYSMGVLDEDILEKSFNAG